MDRKALMEAMQGTATSKPRAIKVPKWGTVYVRDITVDEADEASQDTGDEKDKHRIARGVARVLCDEQGNRLFDPANEADVALLGKQPWSLLRRVVKEDDEGN